MTHGFKKAWTARIGAVAIALLIGSAAAYAATDVGEGYTGGNASVPDPDSVATLDFYNPTTGAKIQTGSTTSPFGFAASSAELRSGDNFATLFVYSAASGTAKGAWTGSQLSGTTQFSGSGAVASPGGDVPSGKPFVKGSASDETLAQYLTTVKTDDQGTYQNVYEIRLRTSSTANGVGSKYAAGYVRVSGTTWTKIDSPTGGGGDTTAGAFTPLAPARVLDTREPIGAPKAKIASGGSVSFQVSGQGGVPSSGAGAVVLNVTVTNPTVGGFVTAYPTGAPQPNASNLNFAAGQTIPNHVTVKLGTGGKVTLYNGSGGTVDLIADVAGWYAAGAGVENGTFTALDAPVRLLDTRTGTGAPTARIGSGNSLGFQVAGASGSGVPSSGVGAGVLNVTVTNTAGGGFLTAFPNGTTPPNASNLNFTTGQTIPNAATVKLGSDGKVALFNGSSGPLDAIADIAGYFKSGTAEVTGAFTPLAPARLLDTRTGTGAPTAKVPSGGSVTLDVANHGGVPSTGAGAAVLNVTVTNTAGGGFVTAYPAGTTKPNASNLNFNPGTTIPNLVTVKLSNDGKVTFYNGSGGPLDLIADVAGWYKG